jgi:putative FmdB family regulatory protein
MIMPMYEYTCQKCEEEFEELVFGNDDDVECPKCNSQKIKRKMSAFAIKSGSSYRPSGGSSSCSGCTPGPTGCSGCH